MREFTLRAVLLGLVMTVILGAANAYLGLRAGMTIAATYPAAVIGMAVLRLMKGSILEENIARTVGSIGESIAAGAIFTIPAFVIAGAWTNFNTFDAYIKSTALMFVGGLLGILFVTFLRRVMVTDPDLAFPESVAAAEIHKAGQKGSAGRQVPLPGHGHRARCSMPSASSSSSPPARTSSSRSASSARASSAWAPTEDSPTIGAGGTVAVSGPGHLPRLPRRRLHHRPAPGRPQLRRRRPGLGPVRPPADVLPRARSSSPSSTGPGVGRGRRRLGRHGHQRLEVHHPADRRRRHARRRRLHALQDAEEPRRRHQALARRRQEGRRPDRGRLPPREGPQHQGRPGRLWP